MPWWKFWERTSRLKEIDPHSLAFWLVGSISERKPPFTMWRQDGMSFTEDEEAFVEVSVWTYQVFTFLRLLQPKFGVEIPRIVREHLLILLNRGERPLGDQMKALLEAVERGYERHTQKPLMRPDKPDAPFPLEVSVAAALLSIAAESTENKEKVFWNLAWALDCGKIAAEHLFTPVIEKMEFRTDTVFGLAREPVGGPAEKTYLIWSESPGCFERHLQRRCDNPLFPAKRRIVFQSEIDAARARDAAEAEGFRGEYRHLLEQVAQLSEPGTVHQVFELRQKIEDLLERAAQLGGDLEKERASLHELYGVTIASVKDALDKSNLEEATGQLQKAEAIKGTGMRLFHNDFIAQIGRDDTPIKPEEVVPALLTEDPETIQIAVEALNFTPETMEQVRREATQLIGEVEADGGQVPGKSDKLRALGLQAQP